MPSAILFPTRLKRPPLLLPIDFLNIVCLPPPRPSPPPILRHAFLRAPCNGGAPLPPRPAVPPATPLPRGCCRVDAIGTISTPPQPTLRNLFPSTPIPLNIPSCGKTYSDGIPVLCCPLVSAGVAPIVHDLFFVSFPTLACLFHTAVWSPACIVFYGNCSTCRGPTPLSANNFSFFIPLSLSRLVCERGRHKLLRHT